MFYPSNARDYFSLSADTFDSDNKHKSKKVYMEIYLFLLLFFNRPYLIK